MAEVETWNRLDGVKALVDSGIQVVPQLYRKSAEKQQPFKQEDLYELDVIDLSGLGGPDHGSIVEKLGNASQELGFFQIVNHGIDTTFMNKMLDVAHKFFEMPLEKKMLHYTSGINARVRYGTSFNPLKEKVLDWSDNLLHRFMPQHEGPHPWPQEPPAYREVAEEYFNQVCALAKKLNGALSQSLGLPENYLENVFGKHQVAFRHNYYPPCPNPELVFGLSGHSDVGGLTLLLQDLPGLQVKIKDDWKTIKPVPGALVINIGDQIQILTNGRFRSVEHRAVVNSEKARVSVAAFWDPAPDVLVAPIPELLDDTHPPLYHAGLFEDYVKNLYSKHLVGKDWVESKKKTSDK